MSTLLYEEQTEFQNIKVVADPHFGRMLVLDDDAQFSDIDADTYHELMVHPFMPPDARRVLILGGGDGATICVLNVVLSLSNVHRLISHTRTR